MDPQSEDDQQRQLAELRRELRSNRRWLIYLAVVLSILLFVPRLAAFIAETSERVLLFCGEYLGGVAAVFVLVLVGAFVVSQFRSASPEDRE